MEGNPTHQREVETLHGDMFEMKYLLNIHQIDLFNCFIEIFKISWTWKVELLAFKFNLFLNFFWRNQFKLFY